METPRLWKPTVSVHYSPYNFNYGLLVNFNLHIFAWKLLYKFIKVSRNASLQVKRYQKENNLNGKAILLVDNFSAHYIDDGKTLQTDDGNIVVMYLPPNVTPLIQPMDQHVIKKIQANYKCRFALRLVNECEHGGLDLALKSYTIRDALDLLNLAWKNVTALNLSKSWDKILQKWDDSDLVPLNQLAVVNENETVAFAAFSNASDVDMETSAININQTLHEDVTNSKILLQQITNTEIDDKEIEEWFADKNYEEIDSEDSEEENAVDVASLPRSSHRECLEAINVCILWAQKHSSAGDICMLKGFADKVMQKKMNQNRQLKLTDFFEKS